MNLLLQGQKVACVYDLVFISNKLILRINNELCGLVIPDNSYNTFLKDKFEFLSKMTFFSELGKDLGFSGCIKFLRKRNSFLEYEIPISQVVFDLGKCQICNASGYVGRMRCVDCNGQGKVIATRHIESIQVASSLQVIFAFLSLQKVETSNKYQTLVINTFCVDTVPHGASFGGVLNSDFNQFFLNNFNQILSEVVEAMRFVGRKMRGKKRDSLNFHSYNAHIRDDGYFVFIVPGNATEIHSYAVPESGRGSMFTCHNLDTQIQQMELLSGLAVLNCLVRKFSKTSP